MYILGISCFYHDAAACLLKDGQILAAAEEERFTRKKHDFSFPENAIRFCLREAVIEASDIDHVVFYEKPLIKFERLLFNFLATWPYSYGIFLKAMPVWLKEKLHIRELIKTKLGFDKDILFTSHHESHAASAFYASPFKKAAILTADAVGEWGTTSLGIGDDNKIKIIKEINYPHSLGLLYSAVTAFLGFKVNNDEYKVMGLAPYGEPKFYEQLKEIIDVKPDGSYRLDMNYFAYHKQMKMYNRNFNKVFGRPRKPESEITKRDKDLACSMQRLLEDILLKIADYIHKLSGEKNLCIAGGVGLNCVANGRLLKDSPFENIFVQPAAGDAGGALGAAYYVYNNLLNKERVPAFRNVYLGPSYTDIEIEAFLKTSNISYEKLDMQELNRKIAAELLRDKIVGWFQGKMELGPRALGNRSILASPARAEMKDVLNKKIKFREAFRPFAPVVIYEKSRDYFELDRESPFMLFTVKVKKEARGKIPAVTHINGTARVQTLKVDQNERLYDLLTKFGEVTGLPVLINTSFNVRGEPIVCTPEDAYKCFLKSGLDLLVLNNCIIRKEKVWV